MTEPTFTKTTPGHACKLAAVLCAAWRCPESNADWREAVLSDGTVVAFHDATGWHVNAAWAGISTEGVEA